MEPIRAILFEPVGCLAEFPSQPFDEMAGRTRPSTSSSRSYWHLLNVMEQNAGFWNPELEWKAVREAILYEDVQPALAELKDMGVDVILASSLSTLAVENFLERFCLQALFSNVWTRDNSGGIKGRPLECGLGAHPPGEAAFLADTLEGLNVARSVGVSPILMMNDPDESKRLVTHEPAGGVVSLHEVPDFVRIVAQANRGVY